MRDVRGAGAPPYAPPPYTPAPYAPGYAGTNAYDGGFVPYPEGRGLAPKGVVTAPEGRVTAPEGRVTAPEVGGGGSTAPDGSLKTGPVGR